MQFWQLVQRILAKDLIFIDKSGVNLAMIRLRARAPKGKRAHSKRPQKRGKNVSLIGAIGLKGLLTQVSLIGATDGLTFEAFITCRLVPKLWPGACVVMDNCSIHRGADHSNVSYLIGRIKPIGDHDKREHRQARSKAN